MQLSAIKIPLNPRSKCTQISSERPTFNTTLRSQKPRHTSRLITQAEASTQTQGAYPRWDDIYQDLTKKYGLESITPQEAVSMVADSSSLIVDVRMQSEYEQAHIPNSISVPAFIVINVTAPGTSFSTLMKAAAFAFNGMTPTDNNPNFLEGIKKAAAEGKAIIIVDETGGTLIPSVNFKTGKVSRSLKAAWKVIATGTVPAEKVFHMAGGVLNYYQQGLPMQGEYNAGAAGRTPNVVQ